jgi:hypothetical protein
MRLLRPAPSASILLLLAACTGAIGDAGLARDPADPPGSEPTPGASPELRLLSERAYARTVFELLGVEIAGPQPRRNVVSGHSAIASGQRVGYEAVDAFYEIGARAAAAAVANGVSGCASGDAACRTSWAEDFLERAFRDEVESEARARYLALLDRPEAGDTEAARLEAFLTAVLSAPSFLYRREKPATDADTMLTDAAIATRMSYLLWESPPDDELRRAAREGRLRDPAGRLAELERMLADDRARDGLNAFVLDWMGVFEERMATKHRSVLEGTSASLESSARESFERTVGDSLAAGRGFTSLLASDELWVDGEIANIVGVAPPAGMDLELRALPSVRRGLLTHPLVLAAHTKESGASPFPIGKFIYENVFCETIPPPPPGIEPVAATGAEPETLREQLERATSASPVCLTCHDRIGPPGFAFLPFDPIGRFAETDGAGRPYDTTGELLVGGESLPFDGAAELGSLLAEQAVAQRCVSRRLMRWAFGRLEAQADAPLLEELEREAVSSDASPRALLRALVASDAFVHVALEEAR